MRKIKHLSNSVAQTRKLARNFSKTLKGGEVVALYGELGAGKTTFIQAVGRALGVKGRIPSPSFILARSYPIQKLKDQTFHHVDLYRLESAEDLSSIDLQEIMSNPNNLTLIEWAEKAETLLPKNRINIKIVYKGESEREIEIRSH